jgi:hypothetical protein
LEGVLEAAELDDSDAASSAGESEATFDDGEYVELVAPERFFAFRAGVEADIGE